MWTMPALANMIFACFIVIWSSGVSADMLTEAEQRIQTDPDLSEFYALLQRSPLAKVSLQYHQVTIFAPINTAFQTLGRGMEDPNEIVPYHIANVPKKTDQLGTSYTSLFSELAGSPILWVTHTTGTYHDDIYINNAKMLISKSNIQVMQNSNEQVIHKIDQVLIPTRSAKNKVYNPTAWEFLEDYESLIMGDHRLRSFRQRVQITHKEEIFKTEGGHTFFIPVDEGFKVDRAALIDGKVIDGHVIPKQVLFTAPTKKGEPFQTLANGDNNLRVTISFTQEERDNTVIRSGSTFIFTKDRKYLAGRHVGDIIIRNSIVSRKHAEIEIINGEAFLQDCNSKYFTRYNGNILLVDEKIQLEDGAEIIFGEVEFIFKTLEKFVTCSTGVEDNERELRSVIESLGGVYLKDWNDSCTHLTTPEIKVTLKVLHAIMDNKKIVIPQFWQIYLNNMTKNKFLPNPSEFYPPLGDSMIHSKYLQYNPYRKCIFLNKTFIFWTKKRQLSMNEIISKAGGKSLLILTAVETKSNSELLKLMNNCLVMDPEDPNIEKIYSTVLKAYKENGRRIIPIQEIALAILQCSCEKNCKPHFNRAKTVFMKETSKSGPSRVVIYETGCLQFDSETDQKPEVIPSFDQEKYLNTQVESSTIQNEFVASTSKMHREAVIEIDVAKKIKLDPEVDDTPYKGLDYVKSHTILGDGMHTQGIVLAEIVKANIPVKNGVVHLIQKPLMIVDNSVKELLLENQWGLLSTFVNAINESGSTGQDFLSRLNNGGGQVTLFAPCSSAWNKDLNLKKLIKDPVKFKDILDLHLVVDDRLYVERILQNTQNKNFQSATLNKRQNLYFNVNNAGNNRTVTVEGGGVNATVLQADLAATNGIIHIIDRVLGVPYSTILDKMEQDHQLNISFQLGMRRGFNNYLNDTSKKYTFFVPRDSAWREASIKFPSTTKVLMMPDYAYHSNNILERHLVATEDEAYTMERIKEMSNFSTQGNKFRREIELKTVRGGSLRLYVEEKYGAGQVSAYTIHWNGERIPVYRPNVECTNGIIHVIDMPLLQESDVHISGASMLWITSHLLVLALTCLII